MSVDRWFIGGGAEHTPESARRLVYASTGGAEGVGGATDLQVAPLAVPGGGVRVTVGSALIRSLYVGGDTQTYMGTVYEQETVAIAATGSGAGRSDLIVLRVEDPFAAGSPWDPPGEEDIALAPYVFVRVISGVPSGTKRVQDVPGHETDTAVTLARIDLPASTGTVTAGEIVDLRRLGQPRTATVRARETAPASNSDLSSGTAVQWPPVGTWVPVPEWATHVWLNGEVSGAVALNAASSGDLWLRFGPSLATAVTPYNEQGAFGGRLSYPVGAKIEVPPALRGTSVQVIPMAKRNAGTGILRSYWGTVLSLDCLFVEEAG